MAPSIVIDDSDPAIQYHGGSWLQCSAPNITEIGEAGSPMFDTLHMLPTANGTLTYIFNGSGISVFVSNFGFRENYTTDYTTKCLLNGASGEIVTNSTVQRGNNMKLCTFGGLNVNKTHNFTLDVTFPAGQHQNETGPTGFLFDYFLISPPPSMSLEKRDLLYTTFESFLQSSLVGNTWSGTDVTGGGYEAGSEVVQFNISFTGVAAWWYGFRLDHDFMPANKSAPSTTYSVDNTTSVTFNTLPFNAGFGATADGIIYGEMTHQLLFHTSELQYGKHLLNVFSPGSNDAGVNPLTIQNLMIQGAPSNNSLSFQTTIVPSPPTSPTFITLTPGNGPGPQTDVDVGKIVGGVVGGMFAVVAIAACLIVARRTRVRRDEAVDRDIDYLSPEPFSFEADQGDTAVAGPRKARETQTDVVNPFMPELEAPPLTKWTRGITRQSGSQSLPSAGENQSPQPEVNNHPGSHLQTTVLDANQSSLPVPHTYNENVNTADGPVEIELIPEEDSRLRLAQQGNRVTIVPVLPPVYTAH